MEERKACAHLKQKFEAAGFFIEENQSFDEGGVRFDMDGFDARMRVGYEYVTREAGDDWDVDGEVINALAERMKRGELYVLVIDEANAPDEKSLGKAADAFLEALETRGVVARTALAAPAQGKAVTKPPPAQGKAVAKPPPAPKAKAKAKPKPKGTAAPPKTPAKRR